jgi:tetratricopeptide (TPR) repeat protein
MPFDESQLTKLEQDLDGWSLSAGVKAIGELCCAYKEAFGSVVLTTNFDPLIEVSIGKSGGHFYSSMTHSDGNLSQTTSSGTHVVHLHGYWRGSDTLHTPIQLTRSRPQLKNSLSALIKNSLVVVMAYGGWDDVITESLATAVADDSAYPEIIWTFYSSSPQDIEAQNAKILAQLSPGISRARVALYKGINCHEFLPLLLQNLNAKAGSGSEDEMVSSSVTQALTEEQEALVAIADNYVYPAVDAFPKNELWYGRDDELRVLLGSSASVISISGMGGQGKSALASTYMNHVKAMSDNNVIIDWRDCREQASTIHAAVSGALARIAGSKPEELGALAFDELATAFANRLAKTRSVIVFDNVDQYVDLENGNPLDQLRVVMEKILAVPMASKVLFTSRPRIYIENLRFQEVQLTGLNPTASKELFDKKSVRDIVVDELTELMELTRGHPLWISFIATQCSANGSAPKLQFAEIRAGKGDMPEITMRATWKALSSKGQQLLRVLAELERPERVEDLDGLAGMRWNQLQKALSNLDKMSLIVYKQQEGGNELIDLHPMVRSFVRREFPRKDRQSFISDAIVFIQKRLDRFNKLTGVDVPFEVLDIWLHKIELYVNIQDFQAAIETLIRVDDQLQARGLHEDIVRLSKKIMHEIDWSFAILTYSKFDSFVSESLHTMVALDGAEATERWLSKYEASISGRGLHYINLCEIRAYINWFTENYEDAIHWAELGVTLKQDYDVETPYDCAHTLALAQRDSGQAQKALDYFLYGSNVEECVADNDESQRDGLYFGNVGRCLHLIGQLDSALVVYRKVARLFERDGADALNHGYLRFWVGQILQRLGRIEDALFFYILAIHKWESISPFKAAEAQARLEDLVGDHPNLETLLGTPIWRAEKRFIEWSREK